MQPSPIDAYIAGQSAEDRRICDRLRTVIDAALPGADSRIWHAHPVWFLDGNPIVGFSRLKAGIRLMFWSGADFEEAGLQPGTGKFKDASALYTAAEQIDTDALKRWLGKAEAIQWDYKNLIRKRRLERLVVAPPGSTGR
jgi:hypothetical protein